MVKPIFEDAAPKEIQIIYDQLKHALEVRSLPLFFAYIGAFPEYLQFITDQLTDNLRDPSFRRMSREIGAEMITLTREEIPKSEELSSWLTRYSASPSFYHFQQDLQTIMNTNTRLAFIFVALREAVKGWAVAAKKLPTYTYTQQKPETTQPISEPSFIFEDIHAINTASTPGSIHKSSSATSLTRRDEYGIEKDVLPSYLRLCQRDFYEQMKTTHFWEVRVGLEKLLLNTIPLLPHLIFSPINVVLELTKKYDSFPDLLYLMSEHFPTYAMQRLMFSAYMSH